jgi:uncharacterized protein (TIGR03083 family)
LADRDESRPVVLLAHQPVQVHRAAEYGVDLQLSGHTHGGQLVPFNLLVRLDQPVVSDLAEVVTERRAALSSQDQLDFDEPSWTPAGEDSYGRFMRIRVMDQWFHEQDVREATGRHGHLEGVAPELVLDEVGTVLGYVVGKQAQVPEGSSVRLELTGPLARRFDIEVAKRARVVDALDRQPTATLSLPGEIFFRVAGGRRRWDDPSVRSQVNLAGDQALAEQRDRKQTEG